jgi:hypothetical protein
MKKLFETPKKSGTRHYIGKVCIAIASIFFAETANAASLEYVGNAESKIELLAGKSRKILDEDRLSFRYKEAIAPIFVAEAQSEAQKFIEIPNNSPTTAPEIATAIATSKYNAEVNYGFLRGLSQSEIKISLPPATREPVFLGTTFATQNLSWKDKLTVTSQTIPPGKTVKLKFTLKFTRYLRQDKLGEVKAAALWQISGLNGGKKTEIAIANGTQGKVLTTTETKIVTVKVGQSLDLVGSLELSAKIRTSQARKLTIDAFAIANAENTALFYIDPVDRNVAYTTESGKKYLTASP